MILARYINSYQDEMPLSQAEELFEDEPTASEYFKKLGFSDEEINIDTSTCEKTGWEFQTIAINRG